MLMLLQGVEHLYSLYLLKQYKLYQCSVKYDLRKHIFTNRVVSL